MLETNPLDEGNYYCRRNENLEQLSEEELTELENTKIEQLKEKSGGREILVMPVVLYYDKFDKLCKINLF